MWSEKERVVRLKASVDFRVELTRPLDIPASLELFRSNGDDLLDRWDGATLTRTLRIGNEVVPYTATNAGSVDAPALLVKTPSSHDAEAVKAAIRAMFLQPPASYPALLLADPVVAALDTRFPGLRTVRQFDLFAALIRCVSAQQVNLRWATTTRRRLAEAFGDRHTLDGHAIYSLNPTRVARADVAELRALQFTTRKAEYIIAIAEAIASGALGLATLSESPDGDVIARLTAIRGVGRWTAEWILARTLGRPVVVAGDLGVRKGVGRYYLGLAPKAPLPSEEETRRAVAHWGGSANLAQTLLLAGITSSDGVTPGVTPGVTG
jgi:DNA-3-methyladenine glycosylase II